MEATLVGEEICHTYGIRTTLDIDDRLMEALMSRYPGRSKTKAVEAAIEEHVRRGAADRLLKMRGNLEIEDVSKEMRAIDRRI
jgi:Arc/MetJ family transcription regulator